MQRLFLAQARAKRQIALQLIKVKRPQPSMGESTEQ